MEKQFIPYELALEIKALGFNEPCFAIWSGFDENNFSVTDTVRLFSSKFSIDGTQSNTLYINSTDNRVSAPLWQQAFDWFREKGFRFNIQSHRYTSVEFFMVELYDGKRTTELFGKSLTYEEARLECLKKLIEIVKNERNIKT